MDVELRTPHDLFNGPIRFVVRHTSGGTSGAKRRSGSRYGLMC